MKKVSILLAGLLLVFSQSCTQQKANKKAETQKTTPKKVVVKSNPSDLIFKNLDQTLSPFEDLTEFALSKNDKGIEKSLGKIENALNNNTFKQNLKPESIAELTNKITSLKNDYASKDYANTALTSAEIFNYNVSNFKDADKIPNQIKIEHLDYLGFKVLALIDQKNINWNELEKTTTAVEAVWKKLATNVKDPNLKASFNLLFKGLHLSAKEKNKKMLDIFANMDLDLVDVLENTF
ncbi:MAG TPA: hypothetical protein ENK64_02545 [Flavobacteriales bacterium]|nr:hypothetical protein [Flavobacteriales bacterium]